MEKRLFLFSRNIMVRNRVKTLLSDEPIHISMASDNNEVHKSLELYHDMSIVDAGETEIDFEDIFDTIKRIKLAMPNIALVILTGCSKREVISKLVKIGVTDILLKPVDYDHMLLKIRKYIVTFGKLRSFDEIDLRFSLSTHLSNELYKAKKGSYSFTLMKLDFSILHDNNGISVSEKFRIAEELFDSIKMLFWETDVYIQLDIWSHFGFFPFCSTDKIPFIKTKVGECIDNFFTRSNEYGVSNLALHFATFPDDGDDVTQLLDILI